MEKLKGKKTGLNQGPERQTEHLGFLNLFEVLLQIEVEPSRKSKRFQNREDQKDKSKCVEHDKRKNKKQQFSVDEDDQ